MLEGGRLLEKLFEEKVFIEGMRSTESLRYTIFQTVYFLQVVATVGRADLICAIFFNVSLILYVKHVNLGKL